MGSTVEFPTVDEDYYSVELKGKTQEILGCHTKGICSKKIASATFVCINCGVPYHMGCLSRLKNKVLHIKNNLIKCCEVEVPTSTGLNTDILLEENKKLKTEKLQLEKKYNDKDALLKGKMVEVEKIALLQKEIVVLKEKNVDILQKLNEHSTLPAGDEADQLKNTEISYLRELNELLRYKNSKLEEEMKTQKACAAVSSKPTFKQALLSTQQKPQNKGITIIAEPAQVQLSTVTEKVIKSKVNLTKLKVKNAYLKPKGGGKVEITCSTQEEADKIKKEIKDQCTGYKVADTQLRRPRIKIVGYIDASDRSVIENTIITQNNLNICECYFKLVHMKKSRNKENTVLFAEVNKYTYELLLRQKKIAYEWSRLAIYDDFNINRCFKCCNYFHTAAKCLGKQVCSKCGGDHRSLDCQSQTLNCTNCSTANQKFQTKYPTNHACYDLQSCSVFRKIYQNRIKSTDYGSELFTNIENGSS